MVFEKFFKLRDDGWVGCFESDFARSKRDAAKHKIMRPRNCCSTAIGHRKQDEFGVEVLVAFIERMLMRERHAKPYHRGINAFRVLPVVEV